MNTYIGIDPGINGCMAAITDGIPEYSKPLGNMTEHDLWHSLTIYDPAYCVIERVRSSPQMGVVSAFTFGRGYGTLLGLLVASGIPFVEVLPNKWQGAMGCKTGGDKNVSKRKAQQLFPELKITHSNADALLLATYCKQHWKDLF